MIANSASDLLNSPGMKSRRPHSSSALPAPRVFRGWTLLLLALTVSTAASFAQNVGGFLIGKIQNFQQTSSAPPVVNSAQPFQFGSLITVGTATINSATLTFGGTASPRTYGAAGNGDFSILDTFTTQSQMDLAYQNGNFTVTINTSAGTFARTIFLFPFSYPTTPLLTVPASNWQSGALAIDPTLDYTFTWNAFSNARAADVIELVIRDSGTTFGPFPAAQTSFTLPAGSLQPGTSYVCDLAFVRVAGATAGDANIGPGYATLVKDTGFTIRSGAPALALATAASRKDHGSAGTFDIDLPLAGEPGVECRNSGGNHTLIITFSNTVVSGNAAVTSGIGSVAGNPVFAGNTMTVNLTGVTDVQKITVTLSNVTDSFAQVLPDTAVSVNMLIGDTNGNKSVNASDIGQTKGQSGAAVTSANFRTDVNANGSVSASDIAQVKANAGHTLP
jgi:Dockerin type I domain